MLCTVYANAVGPEMECDSDEMEWWTGEHDHESWSPMNQELNKLGIQMATARKQQNKTFGKQDNIPCERVSYAYVHFFFVLMPSPFVYVGTSLPWSHFYLLAPAAVLLWYVDRLSASWRAPTSPLRRLRELLLPRNHYTTNQPPASQR